MTHSLPLLCLAVISYLFPSHNATAQSLSELNPAPVELNSSLVSADTYQVAGIYHIVDYSKKMESFFGKRVNETDQDVDSRTCEQYGFVGNCTAPAVGKGIKHPIPGLTCYEKCVSCAASGYVDSCLSPKTGTQVTTADGLNCYKNCQCPAKYKYTAYTPNSMIDGFVRIRCPLPAVVAGETCQTTPPLSITATGIVSLYTQCNCPSEYNLTSKLNNADCEACTIGSTTKYKCVTNCSAYPLTVCPEGCNCSSCADTVATKYKIDSAKPSWGISSDGITCNNCDKCPTGYTAGVTECDSSSTLPDYHKHATAQSCGKACGYCACDNTKDCSAYTLTSQSDANAVYESCNTGCGSAAKTTYKITSCKANYLDTENYWCSVPEMDCTTLGYTKTVAGCTGKQIVKCPFDETKIACFESTTPLEPTTPEAICSTLNEGDQIYLPEGSGAPNGYTKYTVTKVVNGITCRAYRYVGVGNN